MFQNAFDKDDAYTPIKKQYGILSSIITLYHEAKQAIENGTMSYKQFATLPVVAELPNLKQYAADDLGRYDTFKTEVRASFISKNVIA